MNFFRIFYFSGKAIDSIRQNPFINLITVSVIAISFLIFSSFLMLFSNLNSILLLWEEEVQIEAYLQDGLNGSDIDATRKLILEMPETKELEFISKDEALKRFKVNMGGMGAILQDLGENPLPSSFEVRLGADYRGFDSVERVAKRIKGLNGIDDVVYGQEWAERFSTSLAIVKLAGLIIGAFLLMATIFIVSNTIKLTVYTKKEELEIARLLGATNSFIKFPFYIEGLFQGLIGSGLSLGLLYILYRSFVVTLAPSLQMSMADTSFQVGFLSSSAMFYILMGGMALGLFGSFVSLGRFLKV